MAARFLRRCAIEKACPRLMAIEFFMPDSPFTQWCPLWTPDSPRHPNTDSETWWCVKGKVGKFPGKSQGNRRGKKMWEEEECIKLPCACARPESISLRNLILTSYYSGTSSKHVLGFAIPPFHSYKMWSVRVGPRRVRVGPNEFTNSKATLECVGHACYCYHFYCSILLSTKVFWCQIK